MGHHKHNPTAIAAKNGELPSKPKKMGKRERERLLIREVERMTGIDEMRKLTGVYYCGKRIADN